MLSHIKSVYMLTLRYYVLCNEATHIMYLMIYLKRFYDIFAFTRYLVDSINVKTAYHRYAPFVPYMPFDKDINRQLGVTKPQIGKTGYSKHENEWDNRQIKSENEIRSTETMFAVLLLFIMHSEHLMHI